MTSSGRDLTRDARQLLGEVAHDREGAIALIRMPGQIVLDTNGRQFLDEDNRRTCKRWLDAIDELVDAGLLSRVGRSSRAFLITPEGAQVAGVEADDDKSGA
jgi:hypothetical protein